MSQEPRWLLKAAVLAMHQRQLAEHGGGAGIRDEGLLDSALARPENKYSYGEPTLFDLAAAYGFGIAPNHPFVDGNKRTAWVACRTFLRLNGQSIRVADQVEIYELVSRLAAGEINEDALAEWLREHAQPL